MTKKSKISFSDGYEKVRACDFYGCGDFGATRGNRNHQGTDFLKQENELIKAPFDCVVNRVGYPYANDSRFKLVEITGKNEFSDFMMKIMYVNTIPSIGFNLSKGEPLAIVQNIASKYDSRMPIHVHVELRKNGVIVNPEKYFKL